MTKEYFYKRLYEVHPYEGYVVENLPDEFTNKTKIEVICPIHGKFTISVVNLLNGRRCKYCNREDKGRGPESFKKMFYDKYGDDYECNTDNFIAFTNGKINFYCKKHKKHYQQVPDDSLKNVACPDCVRENYDNGMNRFLKEVREKSWLYFNEKIKKKYGNSLVIDKDSFTNIENTVKIFCEKHGWVEVSVPSLLTSKRKTACTKCLKKGRKGISFEDFKKDIIEKFGDIYDFSKTEFIDMKTKIKVGINGKFFETIPSKLLNASEPITHSKIENYIDAINEIKRVHGDEYDTSLITEETYKGTHGRVPIICKKHGLVYIRVDILVNGGGCNKCRGSKLQREVRKYLAERKINFIEEYTLDFTFNKTSCKRLDFYLPEYKIGIECQGIQHFKSIPFYGGEEGYAYRKKTDIEKYYSCKEHGIDIYYLKPKKRVNLKETVNNEEFGNIYTKANLFNSIKRLIECSPVSDQEFNGE